MATDNNLFPYNVAVVSIMKGEARYLKEWIDYHLMIGVNHFYIYDNEESDNQKNALQPYVDAGIATHIPYIGRNMLIASYNDAPRKFRFLCRYMAIIDADEFLLPKNNKSIGETIDEILSLDENAGGISINWHCFGSNGH
ncbi:MAG: glycosyltransferase family 92 protein [Selenomonadaceae bacterium]|nr:glycosyltransferase family 92 protein [Selenomonadaceae bacterium]